MAQEAGFQTSRVISVSFLAKYSIRKPLETLDEICLIWLSQVT